MSVPLDEGEILTLEAMAENELLTHTNGPLVLRLIEDFRVARQQLREFKQPDPLQAERELLLLRQAAAIDRSFTGQPNPVTVTVFLNRERYAEASRTDPFGDSRVHLPFWKGLKALFRRGYLEVEVHIDASARTMTKVLRALMDA